MHEFARIEKAELHPGVFNVETSYNFRLGFIHVKRRAAKFGDGRDHEYYRCKRSDHDEPDILRTNNRAHTHRAGQNSRDKHSRYHRHFKGNHDSHLTERPDQCIFIIR